MNLAPTTSAMSDHTLPENCRDWPDDPFELLGLPRETDARSAKRAYTRLIRRYKPERHPEEFRRVRDAYEQVSEWLEMLAFYGYKEETAADAEAESTGDGERSRKAPKNPLTAAWRQAREGDLPGAVAQIEPIARSEDSTAAEACLRLYWLTWVEPQATRGPEEPLDWLVRGAKLERLDGPAGAMYSRRFFDDPEEALSARCEELLDAESVPEGLANLLLRRWESAALLGACHVIRKDLERLGPWLQRDGDHLWAHLMFAALDQLAWEPTLQRDVEWVVRELQKLTSLQLELASSWDRLDRLNVLVESVHRLRQREPLQDIASLAEQSWRQPLSRYWGLLVQAAARLAHDPVATLRMLTTVFDEDPLPVAHAAGQFHQLFALHPSQVVDEEPSDEEREKSRKLQIAAGERFLQWLAPPRGYTDWFRQRLVEYCLYEALDPDLIAELAAREEILIAYTGEPLADLVANDIPLQATVWACRGIRG